MFDRPMPYYVIASDGQTYGPAEMDQLKAWVAENRIQPATRLRDFHSGQEMAAVNVPGLFAAGATLPGVPVPMASAIPFSAPQMRASNSGDIRILWSTLFRSGLGLVFFFMFHGIGLIVTGYALFYAIRHMSDGNRYGKIAVVIAAVSMLAIGLGWLLRINGSGV